MISINRLIAKAVSYTHHSENMIGIDRPNTVCQFRYYSEYGLGYREHEEAVYVVYLYKGVPVAFALDNFMVDFGVRFHIHVKLDDCHAAPLGY